MASLLLHPDWRERDERLYAFLRQFVATPQQLAQASIFPSYETARRRAQKLRQRKRIKHLGTVQREKTGRPEDCYGIRRIKTDILDHEIARTEFLHEWPLEWLLPRKDLDQDIRPDATIIFPKTIHVEVENSRKDAMSLRKRMAAYEGIEDFVVWVGLTENHVKRLKKYAEPIGDRALFCVLGSRVWDDLHGNTVALDDLLEKAPAVFQQG